MGLLDRGRKGILENGIEGTAKILDLEQRRRTGKARDGEAWAWEEAYDTFAKTKYRLDLEVTLPGREPYRAKGNFKVPAKAERTGLTRAALSRGLELPIRADPADEQKVEVDWDRFAGDPGRRRPWARLVRTASPRS